MTLSKIWMLMSRRDWNGRVFLTVKKYSHSSHILHSSVVGETTQVEKGTKTNKEKQNNLTCDKIFTRLQTVTFSH